MKNLLLILLLSLHAAAFAQYELAICTIFQNDAPYLKEWIEFHKLQGVQHFYLYNNNSTDHYLAVLEPYLAREEVTLVPWSYNYQNDDNARWIAIQTGAYLDCIQRFGEETKWLAVIDSDEFLYCPTAEKLNGFLERYEEFGAVCVNWVRFGTSHVKEIPHGCLMIELLTHCSEPDSADNLFIKSIVQPRYVEEGISGHSFRYKQGKLAVDAGRQRVSRNMSKRILLDQIRINHYWTRTENYFKLFKIPSRYKRRNAFDAKKMKRIAKACNRSSDTTILQFVVPLKKAMNLQ